MKTKQNYIVIVFLTISLMFFFSCDQSGKTKTEEKTQSKTEPKDSTAKQTDEVEVTLEQMKTIGIELGMIEKKNLTAVVKSSGQLTVPPQNKASVNALVGGVIRNITVLEGQSVKKGQVVAYIENPEYIKLQQDYLTSKDNIVYLHQEYERQKSLREADAGIGKVYQQASANYKAEQSKLLALEQQLQQIHINLAEVAKGNIIRQIPVTAPINGTVGHVSLAIGTYTDASSPIMQIVNNSIIYCDLLVYEKDIAKVKPGQKVEFILTNQNNRQVAGRVYGINKSFEGEQRAVIVHAIIENVAPLNLIPGMYISALIDVGEQVVSAVPKDALVKANDKEYIFVLQKIEKRTKEKTGAENKNDSTSHIQEIYQFRKMEVMTGVNELGYVEIKLLEELPANSKIVTKGAFYIFSKMQNIETNDLM